MWPRVLCVCVCGSSVLTARAPSILPFLRAVLTPAARVAAHIPLSLVCVGWPSAASSCGSLNLNCFTLGLPVFLAHAALLLADGHVRQVPCPGLLPVPRGLESVWVSEVLALVRRGVRPGAKRCLPCCVPQQLHLCSVSQCCWCWLLLPFANARCACCEHCDNYASPSSVSTLRC